MFEISSLMCWLKFSEIIEITVFEETFKKIECVIAVLIGICLFLGPIYRLNWHSFVEHKLALALVKSRERDLKEVFFGKLWSR